MKTEGKKTENYQDITFQIKRENNNAKLDVIPVVIDTLGSYTKNVNTWIEKLKIPNIIDSVQL